jgi:hypothetical protein
MLSRVWVVAQEQGPQSLVRLLVAWVRTEKLPIDGARCSPLPQAEVGASEGVACLPAIRVESQEPWGVLHDGAPMSRFRGDGGLGSGGMDGNVQPLHFDRFSAQSLCFNDGVQRLVGSPPVEVELSERKMRQWSVWTETGCLVVGRGGSAPFEPLSMDLSLSQELKVLALRGTQNENQASEEKR